MQELLIDQEQQNFLNNLDADGCIRLTHVLCTFDDRLGVTIKDRFVMFPHPLLEEQVRKNFKEGNKTRVPDMGHFDIAFCTYSRLMVPCGVFLTGEESESIWAPLYPEIRETFAREIEVGLVMSLDQDMSEKWIIRFNAGSNPGEAPAYIITLQSDS